MIKIVFYNNMHTCVFIFMQKMFATQKKQKWAANGEAFWLCGRRETLLFCLFNYSLIVLRASPTAKAVTRVLKPAFLLTLTIYLGVLVRPLIAGTKSLTQTTYRKKQSFQLLIPEAPGCLALVYGQYRAACQQDLVRGAFFTSRQGRE